MMFAHRWIRPSILWWGLPVAAAGFAVLRADEAHTVAFVASQGVFVVVSWLSVAGAVAALRTSSDSVERRMWTLLAVACAAIAIGETIFSGFQILVDARGPTGIWVTDVFYALGAVAFFSALVSMYAGAHPTRLLLARRIVDILGLLAVGFAAIHATMHALSRETPLAALDNTLEAAYVSIGLAILGAAGLNALSIRRRPWRTWEQLLVGGLALYGLAVTLWPVWYAYLRTSGAQGVEIVLLLLFLGSHYLVFMAGVYRVGVQEPAYPDMWEARFDRSTVESAATSTVLLAAIAVLGVSVLIGPAGSEVSTLNFAVLTFVGLMMVLHTAIAVAESGGLRSRVGTDSLTGLPDLRAMQVHLADSVRLYERYGQPVSVVVTDLNDFSRVNVLYGREEGDRLLARVGEALVSACTRHETVGRMGGDDFLIIIDDADDRSARACAERMRAALRGVATSAGLPLAASWGLATCPRDSTRARDLITKAYASQNWAKWHEKDAVVAYDPNVVDVLDPRIRAVTSEEQVDLDMLLAVAVATEDRHETLRFHSRNVAALAVRVADKMGLSPLEMRDVEIAALLHDIGKIGVPDEVLATRGPRSRAGEAAFRVHVTVGARIVEASSLRRVAPAIRAHHERWDGGGYPDGLAGHSIPRISRIIAACDSFECMVAGRPDRPALSSAAALQELDQNMGVIYDPDVAEALLSVVGVTPDRWLIAGDAV